MEDIIRTEDIETSADGRYTITRTVSKHMNYIGQHEGHEHVTYDVNDNKDMCMIESFKTIAKARQLMKTL